MELRQRNPRRQGDLGEAAAIQWLTKIGACVCFPLFHSPDFDLVAEIGGRLLKVQVKTSTCAAGGGAFNVALATSGGNQSWTGLVKRFDPSRCDYLFALVADGRSWFIPAVEIDASTAVVLGGYKYAEFEVGEGNNGNRPSRIDHTPRGGAGVGEPGRPVKSVPQMLSGFDSHPPHLKSSPRRRTSARTRVSANHQITLPRQPFDSAELEVGDQFRVDALGPGRLRITRVDELAADYRRQLRDEDTHS